MFRKFQAVTTIAMNTTTFYKTEVANAILGASTYSKTGNVYAALHTADPTAAGNVGELTIGTNAYARVAVTNDGTGFPAASGGVKSNGAAVTFPAATGSWGSVTHFSIKDASTGGNTLFYGSLTTAKTVASGDTISIPAGQLVLTIS